MPNPALVGIDSSRKEYLIGLVRDPNYKPIIANLATSSSKSRQEVQAIMEPVTSNTDAMATASQTLTETLHDVSQALAVQAFKKTIIESMEYALGKDHDTADTISIDLNEIIILENGSCTFPLRRP